MPLPSFSSDTHIGVASLKGLVHISIPHNRTPCGEVIGLGLTDSRGSHLFGFALASLAVEVFPLTVYIVSNRCRFVNTFFKNFWRESEGFCASADTGGATFTLTHFPFIQFSTTLCGHPPMRRLLFPRAVYIVPSSPCHGFLFTEECALLCSVFIIADGLLFVNPFFKLF